MREDSRENMDGNAGETMRGSSDTHDRAMVMMMKRERTIEMKKPRGSL